MVLQDLGEAFSDIILDDQDLFASQEQWEDLIKLLPADNTRSELQDEWKMDPKRASLDKWEDVKQAVRDSSNKVRPCLLDIGLPC